MANFYINKDKTNVSNRGGGTEPWLLEDDTGEWELEDGTGFWALENS